SRRRHTRSKRDWSSDVCSSDLILSRKLGLEWGEIVNGCAEISGLDDRKVLADFSTRAREIDQWQENNGLETRSNYQRIAQKITRQTKDLDVNLDELETQW